APDADVQPPVLEILLDLLETAAIRTLPCRSPPERIRRPHLLVAAIGETVHVLKVGAKHAIVFRRESRRPRIVLTFIAGGHASLWRPLAGIENRFVSHGSFLLPAICASPGRGLPRAAPSAMRMPSSRVRCATE